MSATPVGVVVDATQGVIDGPAILDFAGTGLAVGAMLLLVVRGYRVIRAFVL